MQENTDQKNSKYKNFLRSVLNLQIQFNLVANLKKKTIKKSFNFF